MTNPYDPDPRDGLSQIPPALSEVSQFCNTHRDQLRLPAQRTSWKLFGFSELLLMVRTMTFFFAFMPPWLMFLSSPHGVNVYVTQFMNDNGSASEQL